MTLKPFTLLLAASFCLAGCGQVSEASAAVSAFPGAEGPGAASLGGRGGRVIRVTNLADSGPGSLRAAVEAEGPRTIVFDVGGTIRLARPLWIRNGRVTIAGQTAPGGGITLRDNGLRIGADDVVVRFIRSRLGDESGADDDSISVISGNRIILDHVSASWGTDETLSVSPNWRRGDPLGDVTVQWSIIADSLCGPPSGRARHCYGTLIGAAEGARIGFHHNLWANHAGRMPRPSNHLPPGQDSQGGLVEIRSNVIANWGAQQAGYDSGPASNIRLSFVDNSYWSGPESRARLIYENRNPFARGWFSGNTLDGRPVGAQSSNVLSRTPGFLLSEPPPAGAIAADPAASAYARVLASAGASLKRDSVDEQVIASVKARNGRLLVSQAQSGGWPQLSAGTAWRDGDGDGMPDDWELARKLDPSNPADGTRDRDGDGYTNLEEWLNALAAPAMR